MRSFTSHLDGYYDAADQMAHDLRRRAEACFRGQETERSRPTTVERFEAERESLRLRFLEAIGGLPEERTPLRARTTGTVERGGYRIELVIYESVPHFPVTANLYLPGGPSGPAPAVLFVCGHSEAGKAEPRYQAVCADLASNGFVVLAVDPPGQGERFQYLDPHTGYRIIGGCTTEHSYAGLQYTLQGASIARQFVWDGIRGVDYLVSRQEVDAGRIGVTGNSGGGTQTCLLMLAEPRFTAGAPCCFVMTLESYLKAGQAQDDEQIVAGAIAHGPDYYQYLAAMAPKPVMVGSARYDFFPIEGAREAARRVREVYRLYGAEDKVAHVCGAHTHGFSADLRQAVVNWMRRHLRGETPDFVTGEPEILSEAETWATTSGQVLRQWPEAPTVFDLQRQRLAGLPEPRLPEKPETARVVVREALGIAGEDMAYPIDARVVLDEVIGGHRTEHAFFFSAADVVVAGAMVHPRGAASGTDLVLLPGGTEMLAAEQPRLELMLGEGRRLFVFDPRGIGAVASRPVNPRPMWESYGTEYKLACDAMMLGTSTFGLRVFDVLRGLAYLRTRGDGGTLGVYGRGLGGLLAWFAAALDPDVDSMTVEDTLWSYRSLAETRYYSSQDYGPWALAWGLLAKLDLPDLLSLIEPRHCRVVSPRDARGALASPEALAAAYGPRSGAWQPRVETTAAAAL